MHKKEKGKRTNRELWVQWKDENQQTMTGQTVLMTLQGTTSQKQKARWYTASLSPSTIRIDRSPLPQTHWGHLRVL